MTIWIDNETRKRVNLAGVSAKHPYKGFSRLDTIEIRERANLVEIADPLPQEAIRAEFQANPDWYTVNETSDNSPPYVTWARKSDEQIAQIMLGKFIAAMEGHYDAVAQAKKYDNRLTCALRAGYAGPFQSDGIAFAQWMDACNAYGFTELAKIQAGERNAPSVEDWIAELPVAPWGCDA